MLVRRAPAVLFVFLPVLALLAGCGGRAAHPPVAPQAQLPTPKSVSPAVVKPAPMAKTAILPASAMTALTPHGARRPQMALRGPQWTEMSGAAAQVAVSPADGSLWVLSTQPAGPDKNIWHYAGGAWTNISGLASQIAVAPDGTLYAINDGGGTYQYSQFSSSWSALGGGARFITTDSSGNVVVLSNAGGGPDYGIWKNVYGSWSQAPGSGVALAGSLDKGTYNAPLGTISPGGVYVLNSAGSIYYLNADNTYAALSGRASAIAPTVTGDLFALGFPVNAGGGPIYHFDLQTSGWTQYGGSGTSLSVSDSPWTSGSNLYVVSGSAGAIWYSPIVNVSPSVRQVQTMNGALGAIESIATAGGAIWWNDGISVGSMAKDGTQGPVYTVPHNGGNDYNMIAGPDGNLWFTQDTSYSCSSCPDYVTRVMLGGLPGAMNAYPLPVPANYTASTHAGPTSIAAGADGNLWITESTAQNVLQIVKMNTSGTVLAAYPIAPNADSGAQEFLDSIAAGPDGNMWFILADWGYNGIDTIGKIAPDGTITRYNLPSSGSFSGGNAAANAIVAGPDGNLWFTEANANRIGKITTSGTIAEYPLPAGTYPQNIAAGPDGNLWLRCNCGGAVGAGLVKVTTAGAASGPYLTDNQQVLTMTDGPDSNLWFGSGNAELVQIDI